MKRVVKAVTSAISLTAILAAWGALGYQKIITQLHPEPVIIESKPSADTNQIVISDDDFSRLAVIKKMPKISEFDKATLILAVCAEACNEPEKGKEMVANVMLNDWANKKCMVLYNCLTAKNLTYRYSFISQSSIGKLFLSNDPDAIVTMAAKPQFAAVRKAVEKVLHPSLEYYVSYGDYEYYLNVKKASKNGIKFFAENTTCFEKKDKITIAEHTFCIAKNKKLKSA